MFIHTTTQYTCTRSFTENIALNKTASQEPYTLTYNGYKWEASLAVDGTMNFDTNGCRCCSCACSNYVDLNWKLDLGQNFSVGLIAIQGRQDGSYGKLIDISHWHKLLILGSLLSEKMHLTIQKLSVCCVVSVSQFLIRICLHISLKHK